MAYHRLSNNNKTDLIAAFSKYVSLNMLGMLGLSLYILADTFFVANGIGADGLAALNLAIPVYSFISGVGQMIGLGGATRYSINQDKQGKDASHVFSQSINFVALAAIPFVLLGLFGAPYLATLFGATDAIHEMSTTYMRVILIFAPIFMLNFVLINFVRNDGAPKLAMLAMLSGSLANIILDYIFIFPLQMGIFGAVLATGLAPIISMLVLSAHFIKEHLNFKLIKTSVSLRELFDIASLGNSLLITEVSSGVVMIVYNTVILAQQGYIGVAAYGIIANISLVIIGLFNGIAQGMQPLLSQNYGQRKVENVKKVRRYGLFTGTVLAIVAYFSLIIWDTEIVSAFNSELDPLLAQTAISGIRIYFIALVFVGYNIISSIYFSAIEQPKAAFIISGSRGFLVIIPAIIILAYLWGMTGVWLAFPFTELIAAVITYSTKGKVAARDLRVLRA